MCGRLVITSSALEIAEHFDFASEDQSAVVSTPHFNIAPTHQLLSLYESDGKRVLEPFHWECNLCGMRSRMVVHRLLMHVLKPLPKNLCFVTE